MSEDRFYVLPPRPEWLNGVPQLGIWQPLTSLPKIWAARHFVEQLFASGTNQLVETKATKLRKGIKCVLQEDILNAGGQHVILKTRFTDGVVWLARIRFPRCPVLDHECVGGFHDYAAAAKVMESEIATMQLVASKTQVPVPRVFSYELCPNNGIGGPCMFMEMVEGETLENHIRKQGGIWGNQVRHLLDQMVPLAFELSTIKFDGIGRLQFGKLPNTLDLVSYNELSAPPFENTFQYLEDRINCHGASTELNEVSDGSRLEWTEANMQQKQVMAKSIYQCAAARLMKGAEPGPFPLQHRDLNQQNVIVDSACNVVAIIDWEHSGTRPYEVVDIYLCKLFRQSWQRWEGLDWIENYIWHMFADMEIRFCSTPRLSMVVKSRIGRLGRTLHAPVNPIQFVEQIGDLIRLLDDEFRIEAQTIMPLSITRQILGTSMHDDCNLQRV